MNLDQPAQSKAPRLEGKRDLLTLTTLLLAFLTVWLVPPFRAVADDHTPGVRGAEVKELRREPDPNDAAKEIVLLSVKFAPGTSSAPHRHPGFLVGYVLAGELEFQLEGQPPQHFRPGDSFYEPLGAVHLVSRNPGNEPTEVLVFTVQPKGQPVVLPAAP